MTGISHFLGAKIDVPPRVNFPRHSRPPAPLRTALSGPFRAADRPTATDCGRTDGRTAASLGLQVSSAVGFLPSPLSAPSPTDEDREAGAGDSPRGWEGASETRDSRHVRPPQDRLRDGRLTCHSRRRTRGGDAIKGRREGRGSWGERSANCSADQSFGRSVPPISATASTAARRGVSERGSEGGRERLLLCHVNNNNSGVAASPDATRRPLHCTSEGPTDSKYIYIRHR